MADDSDVLRNALRGLRRDSLRAQRRRDPGLMIAIGLAEPELDEPELDEDDGDEEDDEETAAPTRMRMGR